MTLNTNKRPAKTRGYQPLQSWWLRRHQKLPLLTFPIIEMILCDETIQIGLAARRAVLQGVEFGYDKNGTWTPGVQCSNAMVGEWVLRQVKKLWSCAIEHIASAQVYGWAGMEVVWERSPETNLWEVSGIEERHANDTRVIIGGDTGRPCGVRFLKVKGAENGYLDLHFPESFFHAYNPNPGEWYGHTVLHGSYRSWADKHLDGGAVDVRRLFMHKDAYGGADLTYPEGSTDIGTVDNPLEVPNRELAREIVEQIEAGGVTTTPAQYDDRGNPLWKLTRATVPSNPSHILQYPGDLDGEMLRGIFVPDGVLKADDTGSWQGRLIPMGILYANLDPWVGSILRDMREQILEPGILNNWGQAIPFVLEHQPLADQALEQQKQQQPQQAIDKNSIMDMLKGTDPGNDDGFEDGLEEDPNRNQDPTKMGLLDPVAAVGEGVLSAAGIVAAAKAAMKSKRMGWVPYKGDRGGRGWRNADTNEVRYQEDRPIDLGVSTLRKETRNPILGRHESKIEYADQKADPIKPPKKPITLKKDGEAMDRAQVMADILQSLYGNEAESLFDKIFGAKVKRLASWNSIDHPRGPDGRFIEKNSPEAVAAARGVIVETLKQARTPGTLKKVTEHLSILTSSQLRDIQREHGIKAGGAKAELVQKIADRLHGKPGQSDEDANPNREDGTPKAPSNEDVFTVPTASLKVDPSRFQYKVKDIGEEGVTNELKGVSKWNPELAGSLLVWRDPKDGQDYVVNGHHRHHLAKRLGADKLNVRYINAADHVEARARGALANIAEGRGSAIDAAKYLKDSKQTVEHLKDAGVSMSGKVAADAAILKDLSNKPFQMVTEGRLEESKALAVAKHLKDHGLQEKLFKKLEDREEEGKEWSTREIETAAKKMASAGKYVEKGQDLFGSFEEEHSTFDQEVELESHVSRMLQQEANDYRAVANKRRADRVADAGNVLAVDENAIRANQADNAISEFDRESRLRGDVSDAIQSFAGEYAKATNKKQKDEIKSQVLGAIRALIGVPKEGDRNPSTGMVYRGGQWLRDGETRKTIEKATLSEAERDWPQKRINYLKQYGKSDSNGDLRHVVLNTDDWRPEFKQYVGTNAADVHEASSYLNKKMYDEALQKLKGKGNNKLMILAGGGGSGQGA
jgi:hypothetical protein